MSLRPHLQVPASPWSVTGRLPCLLRDVILTQSSSAAHAISSLSEHFAHFRSLRLNLCYTLTTESNFSCVFSHSRRLRFSQAQTLILKIFLVHSSFSKARARGPRSLVLLLSCASLLLPTIGASLPTTPLWKPKARVAPFFLLSPPYPQTFFPCCHSQYQNHCPRHAPRA